MQRLNSTKKTWMMLNMLFGANYTLYIILHLIRIPIYPLPNFVNILCLISSYSISLLPHFSSIGEILSQPNIYCIMVFLTFPHEILLLPFYLLSIYHLSSFVLSNKKIFERTGIYPVCVSLSAYHVSLGRLALFTEALAVPLSFLMIFLRKSSLVTFTTFIAMVRQQYFNNPSMRSVFGEMRVSLDRWILNCPRDVQEYYRKGRDFLVSTHSAKKLN
ncbi:transmembrane protein 33 [Encephalitozoon hellem]|nr:transmembrane protein 33 [Encephalitozoon hellem]